MKLKLYQVDAFAEKIFSGNPAAVCLLKSWLPGELLQKIAEENNLAETAFLVQKDDFFEIRWFTPRVEVDLCGHATLASAYILYECEGYKGTAIEFFSPRSGKLIVTRLKDQLMLDFPVDEITPVAISPGIAACFSPPPVEILKGKTDLVAVLENEEQVRSFIPDQERISALGGRGLIITAPGNDVDFVSRFFAPRVGINEDPVTGSAHTTLTPYWSKRSGKETMKAIQLSERKGHLECTLSGERVLISGKARLYMEGWIYTE